MLSRRKAIHRSPPTRIHSRPLFGQLSLDLRPKERLARRRRRRRVIAAFVVCVLMGVSVWGVGIISYNEHFAIDDVSVAGTKVLSPRVLKAAFDTKLYDGAYHLFSRTNVFLFPASDIVRALENDYLRISTLSISRPSLLSQAVRVTITEREPKYSWCDTTCYLMDANGFIFATLDKAATTTGYVFKGGLVENRLPVGQTFLRGRLNGITELFRGLEAVGFTPKGATIENDMDVRVDLAEGFYLKVSFGSDPHVIAKNLELITGSDALKGKLYTLSYVDLRFGDKVYYQMK